MPQLSISPVAETPGGLLAWGTQGVSVCRSQNPFLVIIGPNASGAAVAKHACHPTDSTATSFRATRRPQRTRMARPKGGRCGRRNDDVVLLAPLPSFYRRRGGSSLRRCWLVGTTAPVRTAWRDSALPWAVPETGRHEAHEETTRQPPLRLGRSRQPLATWTTRLQGKAVIRGDTMSCDASLFRTLSSLSANA